jgi:hypothetical protein
MSPPRDPNQTGSSITEIATGEPRVFRRTLFEYRAEATVTLSSAMRGFAATMVKLSRRQDG